MTIKQSSFNSDRFSAWRGFLRTYGQVLPILEQEMQAAHNLPLTWYDVLVQLKQAPSHALRLQDLADAIVLSQSGLTRLLDRMSEVGLVERKPCPKDRRGSLAQITDLGLATLEKAAPVHLDGIERHFMRPLDEADITALDKAFAKILTALKKGS